MASTKSKHDKLKNEESSSSTSLMFPNDLLSEDNDKSCMSFFINVIRNGKTQLLTNSQATPRSTLKSSYGDTPVLHTQSRGLSGGENKNFSNSFIRSDQSVTLPMPKGLSFGLKANWSNVELGAMAGGIDQTSDMSEGKTDLAKRLGLATIGSMGAKFANGALKTKELVEFGTASVANSYAETMFKNIDNRSFTFSWNLTPRNTKEATEIDNILRLFRFHMLPEYISNIGNGNAFLLYPSSVDIVFWQDGAPNKYIPRISTCAITGLDTNYTPNGSEYIRMIDGKPQSYTLTITLSEMQAINKSMVGELNDGFSTTF